MWCVGFPNVRRLLAIYILIPHTKAVVERGFSKIGRDMTKKRCALDDSSLDILMRISYRKELLKDSEIKEITDIWKSTTTYLWITHPFIFRKITDMGGKPYQMNKKTPCEKLEVLQAKFQTVDDKLSQNLWKIASWLHLWAYLVGSGNPLINRWKERRVEPWKNVH